MCIYFESNDRFFLESFLQNFPSEHSKSSKNIYENFTEFVETNNPFDVWRVQIDVAF
jgi:hypothetical protein